MKLIKVYVKKLLFRYSYRLEFRNNITIIHAPNGRGKSMLLKLIKAVINEEYEEINEIPFESLNLYFDNGDFIFVKKMIFKDKNQRDSSNISKLFFEVCKHGEIYNFEVNLVQKLRDIDNSDLIIPGIRRAGPSHLYDEYSRQFLTSKRLIKLYGNNRKLFNFDYTFNVNEIDDVEELLENNKEEEARSLDFIKNTFLNEDFKVNMVETDRLYLNKESNTLAIGIYANEIRRKLSKLLGEYADLSQSLEKTFPLRLLESMESIETLDRNEILEKLVYQFEERDVLTKLGLLETDSFDDEIVKIINREELKDSFLQVLNLYLEDSEKKLKVFEEMKIRVNLFLKILNNRFYDKEISLSKKDGFKIIFSDTKKELEKFYQLSSGEQHSIVLMFKLLLDDDFEEIDMVFIDEPELSLHIDWQMSFLEELEEISFVTGKNFVIATHSPEIVNDRYDLLNLLNPLNEEELK
ncbi:AAA family ATPase [Ureibacillus thermosphaericus]|uniref:AAA family ATPase n=1 Tax=Ureibacillus thermosphaericus TaxID=51173 RepID=UPI0030C92B0E